MKFELRKPVYAFQGMIEDYFEIYITKNEFLKSFEKDKEQCYQEFSMCVEMYTTPCCFRFNFNMDYIEAIYSKLKSKSKYKGIILNIKETTEYSEYNQLGQQVNNLYCAIV